MAEALTKKKIRSGHRASATWMVNQVSETITAFEADPTTELDVKGTPATQTQSRREVEHTEEVRRRNTGVGRRSRGRGD